MQNIVMEKGEFRKQEKYHYWRGFRACMILVVAPGVLLLIVLAQLWVNANI